MPRILVGGCRCLSVCSMLSDLAGDDFSIHYGKHWKRCWQKVWVFTSLDLVEPWQFPRPIFLRRCGSNRWKLVVFCWLCPRVYLSNMCASFYRWKVIRWSYPYLHSAAGYLEKIFAPAELQAKQNLGALEQCWRHFCSLEHLAWYDQQREITLWHDW